MTNITMLNFAFEKNMERKAARGDKKAQAALDRWIRIGVNKHG